MDYLYAIILYVVLMLAGTNLLGFIVRGIFNIEGYPAKGNSVLTIFMVILAVIYFYFLYKWFNVGILITGIVLMLTRLPDLLYEIRTGKKVTRKHMPKSSVQVISGIIMWIGLPVVIYFVCWYKK